MTLWIADIEANGLDDATKIHCIVLKEYQQDNWKVFIQDECDKLQHLQQDTFVFHNGVMYDIPTIRRLLVVRLHNVVDTYICSKMLFPMRGEHNLESWGEEFGVAKPQHEDWENFSEEMLTRCKEDVKITELLYTKIKNELEK